jgi:hypothetical protein
VAASRESGLRNTPDAMDDRFDRDHAAWVISEQIRLAAEAAAAAAAGARGRRVIDLAALVLTCAPLVAQDTARALIQVESGGNPFAIGVVGGALVRQPANLPEAVATVAALEAAGWNYSVGLGQINKRNFQRYGLTPGDRIRALRESHRHAGHLGRVLLSCQPARIEAVGFARRLQLLLLRQLPDRSPTRLRGQGPRSVVGGASKPVAVVLSQDPPTLLSVFTPISNASTNPGASQ